MSVKSVVPSSVPPSELDELELELELSSNISRPSTHISHTKRRKNKGIWKHHRLSQMGLVLLALSFIAIGSWGVVG